MTRILIADDHDVVRSGLRSILEARWEIVAEATNGKEAIRKAIELKPDVAVLDYSLPLINGVEATRQIRARVPAVEVLIFTMHDSEGLIHDLLEAGARGYLLKSDAKCFLVNAVESLAAHRPFFTAKVSETLLESYLTRSSVTETVLTARERSVVQLIAEGHSNKKIADILSISVKTVETHRAAAMRKLNISSAAALVRYAVRNKIVEACPPTRLSASLHGTSLPCVVAHWHLGSRPDAWLLRQSLPLALQDSEEPTWWLSGRGR